jgi:four helix bundle protein
MLAAIKSFKDLVVWQESIELGLDVYRVSQGFPKEEVFGLTQQMRRAAVSVSSNIAEGWGRGSTGDYLRFLSIAGGSMREVESQAVLSHRLGYTTQENLKELEERIDAIGRMLHGLRQSLEFKREG